ncbi:CDP-glycerol glycerophosphotransferase family protein [Methanonatronarchaeum sp. AMET6-2]|uniref:CDP-glycerol glycerophosphotransferase family protein n=1 Tax=Methanonatronarchaeum sp. AMET6-2 TaxID=2933293 RepID=UPI001FF41149|nr:CDP-glycerol glycerophosphotransferase family protein [Methanonatronarchaeum sp. AMET6-2]UOY10287.1 CDP-glycerol glycerophosphotransferase family protein [Methanonatronarchaeum sp. AMET6-2]
MKRCYGFYFFIFLKKFLSLIPNKKGLWIFGDGHRGRGRRGGNAKYLFLQLAKENYDEQMVWISQKQDEIDTLKDNGYLAYNSRSLQGKWALLRSEKIFCTNGMDFTWWLTGGADIVQLWHGMPLKKRGWDLIKHRNYPLHKKKYRRHVTYNWDYLITTSINLPADVLRRAFDMESKNTLVTGYPRTDIFFKDIDHLEIDVDSQLLSDLNNIEDSTIFMYAPTWRRDYRGTDKTVLKESGIDLSELNTLLRETDSYMIFKMHPKEKINVEIEEYNRILIAEPGSDPYPLLKHVDCLIADYSSIFIDYLLLDRPLIFFPFDLEDYTSKEGLYYKYESIVPGNIVKNNKELIKSIKKVSEGKDVHEKEREIIRKLFYDYIDGYSAKRIYNQLTKT